MTTTYTDNGTNTPNGSHLDFTFTFPVLQTEDVKVALDGVTQATTKYSVSTSPTAKITFNNTSIDSTVQESTGAPKAGVVVRVYRQTTVHKNNGDSDPKAVFSVGSSIRSGDLNNNVDQALYGIAELQEKKLLAENIEDGAILSRHIKDGEIVDADINASAAISHSKIATGLLPSGITVNSSNIVDNSIVDADVNSGANIQGSKLADDSVALTKLGGGTLPSDIVVTRTNIENRTIQDIDIEEGTLDNRYYTETELNNGQLDNQYYTETELNNGQLDNRYYTEIELDGGVLDTRYYTEQQLDGGQLDNRYYTEAELDGGQLDNRYFTETESDARYFRQDSTETISSGDTWSGSDAKIATTGAIDLRVIDLIDDVGGFVPILHETYFPSNNPDINNGTGTIVSIQSASTDLVPSGTTVTVANGAGGGQAVIITNVPETIPSGYGFLVETTTTTHTYTFHRLVPKATEVSTIAANAVNIAAAGANVTDIHNFADLYQISTSAPINRADGSNLVVGDLWYDSSSNKVMMVYDGSSGDGFTATSPNASDLANIAIVAGQITFTEDLGLITNALTTQTGNTTLNTVAGIATEAATVAGIASDVTAVAADATDIGVVAGKATEIGRLGTADAVADMNTLGTTATVSDMDTLADISSDITTVAGVSSNVTTVAGISSNVTAVAGNATNINAVAADATDIGAVAGKATEIGRLGTADAVADLAILGTTDVVSDLNTLATSAIVSDMDTLADISSNITSVANISSNVTTVAGNNAAVSTVANNDADISTVAGSIGNVNTTAGSISNVNTVAGSIANVNTAASNVTDINTFANRYRIDSSDPGSNNDQGDLYFNTTSNELRVYNGSTWQGGVTATGNLAGLGANTFTGNQTVNANIVVSGTVDGKDISALGITGTTLDNGVTATTQAQSDNSTKVSTTAYVRTAISDLVNSAPSTLDTLGEIATALNNDAALNTTLTNSIATKLPKTGGVMTGDIAFGDNNMIKMGASHDLQIYHGGSGNSYIDDAGTGALIARGNMFLFRDIANNHNVLKATAGAGVDLYHNNSRKFHTRSDGVNVIGDLDMTDADGYKINLGASSDLQIYHDGNDSYFTSLVTGAVYHRARTSWYLGTNATSGGSDNAIHALQNGAVELYWDGNKKFETTSSGATITGTCTATTFSGSGASLTSLNASNISSGTISASRIPTLNQNTTGSSGSCTGTAANANTLDNIDSSSFLRSDQQDTLSGGALNIFAGSSNNSNDASLYVTATTNSDWGIKVNKNNNSANEYGVRVEVGSGADYAYQVVGGGSQTFRVGGNGDIVFSGTATGNGSGLTSVDANTLDGIDSGSFIRSDAGDTASGDITFTGGAGAVTVGGGSDITFTNGNWTGNHYGKIQHHSNCLYISGGSNASYSLILRNAGSDRIYMTSGGTLFPASNGGQDLGTSSKRWNNIYCQKTYFSGSTNYLSYPGGNYGSVQINGSGLGNYEGFSIDGRAVFMHDGSSSTGIYDDVNNKWLFLGTHTGSSYIYNNGTWRVEASSSGATIQGSLTATGNVTAYSDARLKTNVKTIDNALDIVDQLRGVSFDWKESGKHSLGVIAQEVEEVLPELVTQSRSVDPETKEESDIKSVDYGKMVGVLINAIKELRAEVAELKGGK